MADHPISKLGSAKAVTSSTKGHNVAFNEASRTMSLPVSGCKQGSRGGEAFKVRLYPTAETPATEQPLPSLKTPGEVSPMHTGQATGESERCSEASLSHISKYRVNSFRNFKGKNNPRISTASTVKSTRTVINVSALRNRYAKGGKQNVADRLAPGTIDILMRADKDGDGKVTQKELVEAFSGMISTSEFFRKMARTLAVACVLLVVCITAVIIASAVGFKDTTVNNKNILVQYHGAAGNDDQPLSIGALEDVYRVTVAENSFARLREPLRNRPKLVVLDFNDGSFVQFEPKFVQLFATSALVKNLEAGVSLTLRDGQLPVVEYVGEQPRFYESVAPTGLTSLSLSSTRTAARVSTITLYRSKAQQWIDTEPDADGGVSVAPQSQDAVQAESFLALNAALKRNVVPELQPSREDRFNLRLRGTLGVAEQWVLLNVNETDVAALCALVESEAVNGRCGHADAGGPVSVDLSGLSATEREALCAAQQEPALDEACGRAAAPAAAYYIDIAFTFGYLPVTLSAYARNALREALRADPSLSNVSAVSSAIGIEATSAWDAEPHELPRSLHADFHDSVHRALLSSRAGEKHFERRLRAMEPARFAELVAEAERAGVALDGTDELTGRQRRKLTPERFTNAIRYAREEHVTCWSFDEPGKYAGTLVGSTESGATCSSWHSFGANVDKCKAKPSPLSDDNLAACYCEYFGLTPRAASARVALTGNYPRAPCNEVFLPHCVVQTSSFPVRYENRQAAVPECNSRYFSEVFTRGFSANAPETPLVDGWLYNLERVVKWGAFYGSDEPFPSLTFCGEGVHVFVFDTGLNWAHRDFAEAGDSSRSRVDVSFHAGANVACVPRQLSMFRCLDTAAGQGHGTHVAGIAAGLKYGLATCARIHIVKLSESTDYSFAAIERGVNWALLYHAFNVRDKFVNGVPQRSVAIASLGTVRNENYNRVFRRLVDNGIATAVSAGNDDKDACQASPASVGGDASAVVTVGATSYDDSKGSYSNYGSCVDVWAPGTAIASADGRPNANGQFPQDGYRVKSGTSMAAPLVGGVLALLSQAYPYSTPFFLKTKVRSYARDNLVAAMRPQELIPTAYQEGLFRLGVMTESDRDALTAATTIKCIGGACRSDDGHNLAGTTNRLLRLPPRDGQITFWSSGRRLQSGDDVESGENATLEDEHEELDACAWVVGVVGATCPPTGERVCGDLTAKLPDGSSIRRPFYQLGAYCPQDCICDPKQQPQFDEFSSCVDGATAYVYTGESCSPVYEVDGADASSLAGVSLEWTQLPGGFETQPPAVGLREVAAQLATATAAGAVIVHGLNLFMSTPTKLSFAPDTSAEVSLFSNDLLFNFLGSEYQTIHVNENGYACFKSSEYTTASPTIEDHFAAAKGPCFSFYLTDLTLGDGADGAGVYVTHLFTGEGTARRAYATALTYYKARGDGDESGATSTVQAFFEYYTNKTRVVYADLSPALRAITGPSRGLGVPDGFETTSISSLLSV